eukprot:gnl/TRDRNA2_/TRDRNA2_169848_c0_seq1.p1 gnl/TRDRNA2_/TRDRNA2_169848_c0~~gnl/TRDRNA2_/TRDRNA2_169848_c0_seq1.p1  ORF type:complete len:482 (-),score=55.51 gnl/TRDRNA2_/TRDRNA2_169848_c0_seq1:74-1477(-)
MTPCPETKRELPAFSPSDSAQACRSQEENEDWTAVSEGSLPGLPKSTNGSTEGLYLRGSTADAKAAPAAPTEAGLVNRVDVTKPKKQMSFEQASAPPVSHWVVTSRKKQRGLLQTIQHTIRRLYRSGALVEALSVVINHLLAFHGAYLCMRWRVDWRTALLAFLLWPISGLGVTAGAHRLWSHQSYKASQVMQVLLMVMYSIANQGSIQVWASTHALHHSASDTDSDPHNRKAGFWHSHFGWTFAEPHACLSEREWRRVSSGWGPVVYFHDRWRTYWDPFWSLIMPGLVASLWGEGRNGFFVAGALRWLCVTHITYMVNSVAHGPREPGEAFAFDASASGIGPRVSRLVTLLALGEGWHDYHHCFPWDYAAAELGAWDQWNPTKVFIDVCCHLGLASGLRRCPEVVQLWRRRQLLAQEHGSAPSDDAETWGDDGTKSRQFAIVGPLFFRCRVPQKDVLEPKVDRCSL